MKMQMKMVSVLVLFLCAVPAHISHSSPSYYSDRHALLSFKNSLSNHSLQDWSANYNTCNWTGVACSHRRHRVLSLNLTGMALVGPISPFIGNLSFLRILDLSHNNFHGQIPHQLRSLFRLRILRLTYNSLSGIIPSQLGLLPNLEKLLLGANQLTGTIPSSLGNLSSLIFLDLPENRLHGVIPPELGMLAQLEWLALYTNYFTGPIPVELGMLAELQILYLDANNFTGPIPTALSNCTHLLNLTLYENHLTGHIPSQLGKLTELQGLYFYRNQLRGEIPSSISNCSLLQYIGLFSNNLTGHIPLQFGKLSNLQELYLWGNQLSGEIPGSLSNCTLLQRIDLSSNQLRGTVPLKFGKLLNLQRLFLWGNHLISGSSDWPFLKALTNCSYLEILYLSNNHLTGILPTSVGQLSKLLSIIKLASNKIEGNMPSDIGNLTKLTLLDLSDNRFNGTIPSTLSQLQNLEQLYLHKNNLHERIPKTLGIAKRLGLLSLSENMLSGKIPNSLGDLPQLRELLLHHNQLSGKIPSSLGRCQTLEKVDLSYNKLEGSIPPEVAGLPNVHFYVNISSNLLHGSLLEMSKMVMVQAIDVSLNLFSGEIPDALSSCIELQYLNLSWNSFDGPIPTSLTSLKNIQNIDLSSNNLSGAIPMDFSKVKTLQHINLSSNRLTGEVPKGGVFETLDESAVQGNLGLCGAWINLQPCSYSKHKQLRVSKKVIVPLVVGIAIFIVSFLFLVFFYRRHTSKGTPAFNVGPTRISYEELVDATDGFSQTNLLGVGSFGSVYRGILNSGRNIAVKVFNVQDENAHQSFMTECNVLKRVRHRNVIKIISSCSNLEFKALVLPFLSNGSLERWLYPQGVNEYCILNLSDRIRIAMEVAQGVTYLHHHCFVQVIHSDLKPNNVLLGDDMTSYIADFGIAKLLFGNSMDSLTSTNALKGSVGYIAPEYGMGERLSTKGDVYSYGILLLELLIRRRPIDDMFVEGINLQKWVGMNFPDKIIEVVDSILLRDATESEISMVLACLTQLIQVGLVCTRELPQERPNMMEIVERIEKIRSTFLGSPRTFQLPIDISPLIKSNSHRRNTNMESHENWSTSTS